MDKFWEGWWEHLLIKIQNQEPCTEEEIRQAWNFLWKEWKKVNSNLLSGKIIPAKLKMLLALKAIDPMSIMIAPTFLTGIFAKGITPEEMIGFMKSYEDNRWFDGFDYQLPNSDNLIYTNGFGGDQIKTINVSTPSMIIAGALNTKIVKMGSHTYFGESGAENFTDKVGYRSLVTPSEVCEALKKCNVAFIDGESAADFETSGIANFMSGIPEGKSIMKAFFYPFRYHIMCFNFFHAPLQQRGISVNQTELAAKLLTATISGIRKGLIVYGQDKHGLSLDEISNVGTTSITFIENDKVSETITTTPEDWGVRPRSREDIIPEPGTSALRIILEVFAGKRDDAYTDLLAINAAQFLYLNDKELNFKNATYRVKDLLASGGALEAFYQFIRSSNGDVELFEKELEQIQ